MLKSNLFYSIYFVASIIFAIIQITFLPRDCLWFAIAALAAVPFESSNRTR